MIDYDFYRKLSLFETLTDNEILQLNDLLISKTYKKDEVIYKENHPQAVIYIIKSGSVRLQIDLAHFEFKITIVQQYCHFGEIGLFLDTPRICTATAIEDTELIAIKKSDIKQFILTNPGTGIKLLYNFGKSVATLLLETSKSIRHHDLR